MDILHLAENESSESRELGPYRIESLISPDQEGCFTAYRVRIDARRRTSESYHKIAEELYFVLQGSGIAVLDGEPQELKAGDFLRLPPGTRHRFETGGDALVMLDIHSPGSRPDRDVYFVDERPDGFGPKQ